MHLKSCLGFSFLTSGADVKKVFSFILLYNPIVLLRKNTESLQTV